MRRVLRLATRLVPTAHPTPRLIPCHVGSFVSHSSRFTGSALVTHPHSPYASQTGGPKARGSAPPAERAPLAAPRSERKDEGRASNGMRSGSLHFGRLPSLSLSLGT